MTDIGFGLLDRRTVITVLFTLVLMQLLFGLPIPVDIQNVVQLFIDLVVLTGYIYLARTIYRLPVAIIFSTIISVNTIIDFFKGGQKEEKLEHEKEVRTDVKSPDNKVIKSLKFVVGWIILIIFLPIVFLVLLLNFIFTFGELIEDKKRVFNSTPQKLLFFYFHNPIPLDAVFGTLDRIGVVAIAVIATIPIFNNYVKLIGVSGIAVMILLYTLRGNFTAVLKDIIEKKNEDDKKAKERVESEPMEIKNSRHSPMYVEVVNDREFPVEIKNSHNNPLHVSADSSFPLPVQIVGGTVVYNSPHENFPLKVEVVNDVQVSSTFPLPVEITNEDKIKKNK